MESREGEKEEEEGKKKKKKSQNTEHFRYNTFTRQIPTERYERSYYNATPIGISPIDLSRSRGIMRSRERFP